MRTRYSLNSQLSGFPGSHDSVSVTIVGLPIRKELGAGAFSKHEKDSITTLELGLLNGDWRWSVQISETLNWYRTLQSSPTM